MSEIESKIKTLGLILPEPIQVPAGVVLPFSWVRVRGNRAYVSGHIALNTDGTIANPLGNVGAELSPEEGYQAARLVGLAMLATLKRELGNLDRVSAWLRVFGMVALFLLPLVLALALERCPHCGTRGWPHLSGY